MRHALDSLGVLHQWRRGRAGPPPLVLLHGFTGNARAWETVVSAAQGAVLAAAIVGVNLPGHFPSRAPVPGSFEAAVDLIAAALRAARLSPCHLVGYSLGGRICLGLLALHPRLVVRATLVGASPGLQSPAERCARRAQDARWASLLREEGIEAFVRLWEELPLFGSQRRLPQARRRAQRHIRLQHDASRLADALDTLGLGAMPSYWPALARMTQPVDVVAGADDERFRRLAVAMVGRLPRGRLTIVPDCGHNPVLEAPERVAEIVSTL